MDRALIAAVVPGGALVLKAGAGPRPAVGFQVAALLPKNERPFTFLSWERIERIKSR